MRRKKLVPAPHEPAPSSDRIIRTEQDRLFESSPPRAELLPPGEHMAACSPGSRGCLSPRRGCHSCLSGLSQVDVFGS